MTELATIDHDTGELIEVPSAPMTLFGVDNPRDVVARAKEHADVLASVIKERQLYKVISGKAHVYVEAWCLLGSMVGVFPVSVSVEPVEIGDVFGFKATVKAVTRSGDEVGRATAYCMKDEPTWKGRNLHALAAMAETRATSRALRKPLGFIVQLAGYSPTAAEEMPAEDKPQGARTDNRKASTKQHNLLHAKIKDLKEEHPKVDWEQQSKDLALRLFGKESRADLTVTEMSDLIEALPTADAPF